MRIAIVTDAWHPQVSGVVTTYVNIGRELESLGHEILFITPDGFYTFPLPTYPSIRLAYYPFRNLYQKLESFKPQRARSDTPRGHIV